MAVALAVGMGLGLKAAAAVSGVTFVVNSTADAVDARVGDGACATIAGSCTLRAAIQETNALPGADGIEVPSGTYELAIRPLNQNVDTTGDLDITDSLAIRGADAGSTIVDGGVPPAGAPSHIHGLDRLFEVLADGGAVSFSGLTLRDGSAAEYGGAVLNNSTATIEMAASTLAGNLAGKAGGAIDNHLGGTVHVRDSTLSGNVAFETGSAINNNRDGTVTLTDSSVLGNAASELGLDETLVGAGALANNAELDARGTITVTRSRFTDNRAGGGRSGAAISNDGAGTVSVAETTFTTNRALGDGGAIFSNGGEVTVADATFSENEAKNGGALYSTGESRVTVDRAGFTLNGALANGGAIASSGNADLSVAESTFAKNSADDSGGAVSNADKGSVAIRDSSFTENSGLNGGGFANEGAGLVTVEESTFRKNLAIVTILAASGEGGGMYSNSGGEVEISGGAFTENKAFSGGGLANDGGGQVTITGTRFAANNADEQGGGITVQSGAVRMVDIDVVGNVANSALEGGGGISYAGDKSLAVGESAAIEGSRIVDNRSNGDGGGIDSRGDGPLAITTTVISGNTALIGGAIHHVGDAPLLVTRSTLSGNVADNGGGAFTDGDGEATLENTTVSGNRAGQFGGGLLVSSRLTLRNSTVAGNSAPSGGGINNGGGDLVGDGSVFLLNTIVAGNPTGGNCAGTMSSLGGNLDSADTCQFRELSDQPGTDPRLGPLANNDGPTRTHALLADSPAQENAVCTELDPCPPVDQRGVERPRFARSDVGAYESELTPTGGGDQPCSGRSERPVVADFDSWVAEATPGSNFGGDSILKVKSLSDGNQRALVHFTLPAVPPGCRLEAATLRLYSSSATDGRTLEVLRVASEWSESEVTWANQPGTAGAAATTASGRELREWNVLALAREMYSHGDHGFLIRDAVEDDAGEQSFHGSEKGVDRPPELVLIFDDPDAPPASDTCPTTPQSLAADRDSWVSEGSPTNNFGTDSTLKVKSQLGYNARALVQFPLPALPAGCTSIASAVLRLEASSAKEGRTLEALQIASGWSEDSVTWSNQPAVRGPAISIPSFDGPLEWNVTAPVLDMYASANNGFLIRDAEEGGVGDEQTLNGRLKLNDSPPELVLVFDDSTPETAIDDGPVSPTDSAEAIFTFSSDRDDATFECSLDGAAFDVCTSPHSVEGLSEAGHKLQVRAKRPIRAVDPTPASYEWTVAIPPDTAISGPASPSSSPDATLTFSADDPDASFECALDGAAFAACTSPVELTNLADGQHELLVRGIDALGAVDTTPAGHAWTVAVPPETTIASQPPDPSNSGSAVFAFGGSDNGPASAELAFECSLDAASFEPCTSPREYVELSDGLHSFAVRAVDLAGNTDASPADYVWTVDTVAPTVAIDVGPADPSNSSSADFEFSADEAAGFECRLDAGEWVECFSPQAYADLGDGAHSFEVRATDAAGNTGEAAVFAWRVDTVAPTTTIDSGPANPSNSRSASFEFGADEAAKFECRLDGGEWSSCGGSQSYADLDDGAHSFEARATDAAGNTGEAAAYAWTVDTVAPTVTIDSGPADPSNSAAASFAFGADEAAKFECRLDDGEWVECGSPQAYADLVDGAHSLEVRAADPAGNTGEAAAYAWTVDTVAPTVTIDSGPADPSGSAAASFVFRADEPATFECRLDGGEWAECGNPQAYADLRDGAHSFEVRATDAAGNTGDAAGNAWTVDTVAPTTTIDLGPADPSDSDSASFEFSADEAAKFECRLDSAEWTACNGLQSYADLGDGAHSFEVRATDAAGNTGEAAVYAWTIDTVAPTTAIDSGPADPSNSAAASFEFGADEAAGFECRLDDGDWAECGSPQAYADLGEGVHSFDVRATDAAGNVGEAAGYSWVIDTVAPTTTISSGPADPSSSAAASFVFGADEAAGFECRLDDGDWSECSSPQPYAELADGDHSFQVRATDAAGNTGAAAVYAWTVDTVAPTVTIDVGPANPSNSRSADFEFSADELAEFECRLDSGEWSSCDSAQSYADLDDGAHSFEVRATDAVGNKGEAARYAWTIDTIAPQASIDSGPVDPSSSSAARFELSADEAAEFECRLDGGDWAACNSPQGYADLADGNHSFEVRATDAAGNTGAAAVYAWTVDTVAPTAKVDSGPADPTSSRLASFAFSADEAARFECRLDDGDWAACNSPQGYADLADGNHSFQVRATDAAGNTGAAAHYGWTVDTVAPIATIGSGPADPSKSSSASFAFTAADAAGFECRLDAGDWAACDSPQGYADLADGGHSFEVRATDSAGNTGAAAVYAWRIDTVAPTSTIVLGPADPTKSTAASFAFTADESVAFECRLDDGDWAACDSPEGYADLADGDHGFQLRATDLAGNTGDVALYAWTVDTVAPTAKVDSGPADPSNSSAASFAFSADDAAGFECRLDDGDWAACDSPHAYAGLADGGHSFEVRATDAAGNTGAASVYAWTIDTAAPKATIDSGPADPTNSRSASFAFRADKSAAFECRLDAGEWVGCSSPQAYADVADGAHRFEVRAIDGANTGQAAGYQWTVDTVAPTAKVDSGPADPTSSRSASVALSADEAARFECRLDDGDWAACESPQGYADLADGDHSFQVRATDAAGNTGAEAVYEWTVDTAAPTAKVDSGPADPTSSRLASFAFSADEAARFECRLDDGDWAACDSPQGYADLADGGHSFQVRATDTAGNTGASARYVWRIDTVAPTAKVDSGPADPSSSSSASFAFSANESASFECRIDDGDWATCVSPQAYADLGNGRHTFGVRATDGAGNQGPAASFAWTIQTVPPDNSPPDTTLTRLPANPSNSSTAQFEFGSNEPGGFECLLDIGAWAGCSSPRVLTNLVDGEHTFAVRAVDLAGNEDPTPASFTWTVDTTPPETTIDTGPANPTSNTSASFTFSANEQEASFECSLDGAAFAPCSSRRDYTGLAAGPHQFSVRAKDTAGNVDPSPAGHSWVITAPPSCNQTVTALAVADAWIDENSPSNNKGSDSILKVQSKGPRDNFRALVRFALPAVPEGCIVTGATLRLYAASWKPDRTLDVLRLAGAWSENQVSWLNQPPTTGPRATSSSGAGYREWTVTEQVRAMYAEVNNGFLLRDSVESADAEQQFHSREKGENPPQLVLVYARAQG